MNRHTQRRIDAANVRIDAWDSARAILYCEARALESAAARDSAEGHVARRDNRIHRQTARFLRIAARLLGAAGSGAE